MTVDGFQMVHGSPFDEDEYVIAADEAGQAFGYLESRLAFFGHTHVQGGFIWNQSRVETILRTPARSDSADPGDRPGVRVPDQPGVGRPAARRRSARGVRWSTIADAKQSDLLPRRRTTWRPRRRRSRRRACRRFWRTGCPWGE